MFDALSDTAKDAARLIPYLEKEWKPITISIALDIPIDAARTAIYELSDKGIIFRTKDDRPDDYTVAALTNDFLSNKWHESHLIRKVEERFADMFATNPSDGFLLEWEINRRLDFLTKLAREQTKRRAHARALKLIRLAQSWLDPSITKSALELRFLEGRNLYEGIIVRRDWDI
jgi:hypothetical protein